MRIIFVRKNACLFIFLLLALRGFAAEPGGIELRDWRVHEGDRPEWAKPDFDDSSWARRVEPGVPFQPRDGIPKTMWARTTVAVPPKLAGQSLAIAVGPFDDPYDVYVNGVRIGTFGVWTPRPDSPMPRHLVFPIPPGRSQSGVALIAFRRFHAGSPNAFGGLGRVLGARTLLHPLALGPLSLLTQREQIHTYRGLILGLPFTIDSVLCFFIGLTCLAFFVSDRARTEYLFLALCCLPRATMLSSFAFAGNDSPLMRSPVPVGIVFLNLTFRVWIAFFVARISPSYRTILTGMAWLSWLAPIATTYSQGTGDRGMSWVGNAVGLYLIPAVVVIGAIALFRDRDYGGLMISLTLLASSLMTLPVFTASLNLNVSVDGVLVAYSDFAGLAFLLITAAVLFLRFRTQQARQAMLDRDFSAAKTVQESLLEARSPEGFSVETAYLPASEVGGDFYQVQPLKDGAFLLVVGDVSGKGLKAAMFVSMLSGAIRNRHSDSPAEILGELNRVAASALAGGFVTALIARIDSHQMEISSAGHPSPYLDGKELALTSALPLGIDRGAVYEQLQFAFNGPLLFLSDGVLEAANLKGELFGFDRTAQVSTQSASAIAEAARAWGQNDDITVVTVRRAEYRQATA